jgi:hypothetical protein
MFSSNHRINFRQKVVVLIGIQLSCILLLNAYCATEYANEIYAELKEDAEKGIPLPLAIKIARSMEKEYKEDLLPEGWTFDPCNRDKLIPPPAVMESIPLQVKQIWFMDPMDISRANMNRKYKEGKYLLFIDEQKNVLAFDLTLQGYDTETQQAKIKEWLDE